MKSIMEIQFDYPLFRGAKAIDDKLRVIIKNPPYFPRTGDIFDCKWDDYISDRTILKKLEEFNDDDCWVVSFYFVEYSKKLCKYSVVLEDAVSYEKSKRAEKMEKQSQS